MRYLILHATSTITMHDTQNYVGSHKDLDTLILQRSKEVQDYFHIARAIE